MPGKITQPEAIEQPKNLDVIDKPAPPKGNDQPEQAQKDQAQKDQAKKTAKPEKAEVSDKYGGIKKAGKILVYVLVVVAALAFVKYKFFTPPTVVVARVMRQATQANYRAPAQSMSTCWLL